ncbi:MAG: TetR/AcrR family transcriptional regulator [Ignavibacteriaceae bacterium]|nr:TetR/AcrR family transcriptional regulator [Ignavibacteriaceae bacterium]
MDKERKIQIVKAAVKRFARHGYHKTTLDEVARDLRIGKATIYHYFASKDELYYDSIKWETSQYLEEIKKIFNREDLSELQKFSEYISLKEDISNRYNLIYNLLINLLNSEIKEEESKLLLLIISGEEEIVKLILSSFYKDKVETLDSELPAMIVNASWGLVFSRSLYSKFKPESKASSRDIFSKAIEQLWK